jgi:hypothetical protein
MLRRNDQNRPGKRKLVYRYPTTSSNKASLPEVEETNAVAPPVRSSRCEQLELENPYAFTPSPQKRHHRAPVGERGLEQVQADKGGEQEPRGVHPVTEAGVT